MHEDQRLMAIDHWDALIAQRQQEKKAMAGRQAVKNQPGRGVLFHREADGKKPTLVGGLNIDGIEYELSGWENQSKSGHPYVSLTVKKAVERVGETDRRKHIPF